MSSTFESGNRSTRCAYLNLARLQLMSRSIEMYGVSEVRCFESWRPLIGSGKLCASGWLMNFT